MNRVTISVSAFCCVVVVATWLGGSGPWNATQAATPVVPSDSDPMVLELQSGSFLRGELVGVDDGVLSWQSPFMAEPTQFALDRIAGIVTPPTAEKLDTETYLVQLTNSRDQLYGELISIDDDFVEIDSARFGRMKLKRRSVRHISKSEGLQQTYSVPARLAEWKRSRDEDWKTQQGLITTQATGATLYADVELPCKSQIEFELKYSGKADDRKSPKSAFAIYFGTSQQPESCETAFSVESWGSDVVAQRRTNKVGDLCRLSTIESGATHLVVYLDRDTGQMLVYDNKGKQLGEFTVPGDGVEAAGNGITIINRKGTLQLKHLYVNSWSGADPNEAGGANVTLTIRRDASSDTESDKQLVTRKVGGVRLSDGELTYSVGEEESSTGIDRLESVDLGNATEERGEPAMLIWKDGTRLSGEVLSATSNEITMKIDSVGEPVAMPLASLRSWHGNTKPTSKRDAPEGHRIGTLELMDTQLQGWLVDPSETDDGEASDAVSCLLWKSADAENVCRLKEGLYGRIVYRAVKTAVARPPKPAANNLRRGIQIAMFGNGGQPKPTRRATTTNLKLAGAAVHLRSGDTIPCTVTAIDADGIEIASRITETTRIPHALIKAAQLTQSVPMPHLGEKKRARFLTLPRMQREIPPQHLLFSRKGDILRGSIASMDDEHLDLELRLDSYRIPRTRVSSIVWLHPDELVAVTDKSKEAGDAVADGVAESVKGSQPKHTSIGNVQVVSKAGGSRFTFVAKSFDQQTIYGESDVLQNVHAEVSDIDQLLFGEFISRSARALPYHRWCLSSARDPKFVTAGDEESGESSPGTESSLVGLPAPDIKLPKLDGGQFELKNHQGKCVVLDFWATWCGPCLQVMPQVEEVVAEFEEQGVQLFAVNLEETAEQIRATLERRKLDVNVVLDRDGVAAARYEATAIPQTVVIAPNGKVTRVFVGSSRNFKEQLRAAIVEVTSPDGPKQPESADVTELEDGA